jgi:hypothetical protein
MVKLKQMSNSVYKAKGYHIEFFNDRWYIWDTTWVADFATIEECSNWIGHQNGILQ